MNLTINEIASAVNGKAFIKDGKLKVTGVVLDSRIVTDGGVFIATKGERVDGHSFIGQVLEKGVKLIITEKTPEEVAESYGTPVDDWCDYIIVEDSFVAIKKIAIAYRSKLTIPIIGITGSVGKTSTKEFVAGVLSEKYNVYKTEKNFNNELGVPITILRIRDEHEVAVVEMGISDFGEMTRLSEVARPDIAVITNIGQCHLENLKTRDGILKAKTEIFTHMNPDGIVCLFGGDDKLVTVGPVNNKEPLYFGEAGSGKALAVSVESSENRGLLGSKASIKINLPEKGINNEVIDVQVPLPGHHMVINAAAASLVSAMLGLSPEQIAAGIENMQPISGRNHIMEVGSLTVIDDCYNANPVSMKSSIDLLKLAKGKTVAILGDMFELGENEKELHRSVGRYAVGQDVDYVYCIGKLSEYMYEAAREDWQHNGSRTTEISYWDTRERFIEGLKMDIKNGTHELIPEGSNILIKASHGMHFEEIVKLFTEN